MAPTAIHIEGRATINTVAERASLIVDVCDSGEDKATVSKNVVSAVHSLQAELDTLCPRLHNGDISPDAPVSFYSISSLSTRQEDEFNLDGIRTGKQLQFAESKLDIRFRDFATLSQLVVRLSSTPFVQLRSLSWKLTDEKQAALDEQVRVMALRNAIQRAEAYSRVIGREVLTVVKIVDSQESYPTSRTKQTARMLGGGMGAAFEVGVGIDFEPQNIEVSATLDVEFSAE